MEMTAARIKNNVEYYRDPIIMERILEFYVGWRRGKPVGGSRYCIGFGESELWKGNEKAYWSSSTREQIFEMTREKGLDVFASLWRDDGTVLALDIEYFNLTYPGEAHAHPERTFAKIEPVYRVIREIFAGFGVGMLITMTGQGYHFTALWPFEKEHQLLEEIGALEDNTTKKQHYRKFRVGGETPQFIGKAFSGACRLMQFLSHRVIIECDRRRAAGEKIVPVVYSDIPIGPVGKGIYGDGQEAVSLDLTLYSDPVYSRSIRIPFSTYQKHKVMRWKVGEVLARKTPISTCVPRWWPGAERETPWRELLSIRRRDDGSHFDLTAEYAKNVSTRIPRDVRGWKEVLRAYRASELFRFHQRFDERFYTSRKGPAFDFDAVIREIPPCFSRALRNPNDSLLKPVFLQGIVRILEKKNWHPKDIGYLIYLKYRSMKRWGYLSSEKLAYFWTELYYGAIRAGADTKEDLNCISQQERNLCWVKNCGFNLRDYQ